MQEAHKQPPTGVITQGQLSKTASWREVTEAQHAQEALDHIQQLHDPPPAECEEAALILVLTLHSWTWGHTITLHEKTGPPYAPTVTCKPTTATAGEVHLDWALGQGDDEYTVAHTLPHENTPMKAEDPEQTETQPPRPAPQQWTLHRLLAHACTLAEHSI